MWRAESALPWPLADTFKRAVWSRQEQRMKVLGQHTLTSSKHNSLAAQGSLNGGVKMVLLNTQIKKIIMNEFYIIKQERSQRKCCQAKITVVYWNWNWKCITPAADLSSFKISKNWQKGLLKRSFINNSLVCISSTRDASRYEENIWTVKFKGPSG